MHHLFQRGAVACLILASVAALIVVLTPSVLCAETCCPHCGSADSCPQCGQCNRCGDRPLIHRLKTKCAVCGGGTGVYSESSYFWLGRLFVKEWQVGDERAGNPRSIRCIARPSNGPYDGGYYVGGGAACCKGEMRYCNEGTWGWDYLGHYCFPIVDLGYWHGRRDQSGSYKTDGPKIFHRE